MGSPAHGARRRTSPVPIGEFLESRLPGEYGGYPTRFSLTGDATVRHRIDIDTPERFASARLGFDASHPLTTDHWLSLSGQSVLEITAGPVFADTVGTITDIRNRLVWYPYDVWRYVVASSWAQVAEELPVMGRAGMRGDELGSTVVGSRLVSTLMRLGFQLERRWAPYPKWFGTAFEQLARSSSCAAILRSSLNARSWRERQEHLVAACEQLYGVQRSTTLPTVTGPVIEPFHDRPFRVVRQDAIELLVPDPPHLPLGVGSIDQWTGNVAVLTAPHRRLAAARAVRSRQ